MIETQLSGLKLDAAIQAHGIPKAELARRCGISRQWMHTLRTTGTNAVTPELLAKLMTNLNCKERDLVVMVKK